MTEQELRMEALRCAVAHPSQCSITDILARATAYADFIRGATPTIQSPSDLQNSIRFIENCVTLHPVKGLTKLELYEFQRQCVEHVNTNKWSIICKARQMGITTVLANYCLWYALAHPGSTTVMIGNKLVAAIDFLDRASLSAEHLIEFGVPARSTKTTLDLPNGSRILSRAAASDSIRGLRPDLIYIDEAAYISHSKSYEMWRGMFPLMENAKVILASTPSDTEGLFYDQWMHASQSRNGMAPLKIVWTDHPDRDAAWAKSYREAIGERAWKQEFECEFIKREPKFL